MTLAKVVRKGNYQGVSQWGISTSSEITPSRATARKWAELENARHPMNQIQYLSCQTCHKPAGDRATKESGTCYDCKQAIIAAGHLREAERIHAENLARVTSDAYRRAEKSVGRREKAIRRAVK